MASDSDAATISRGAAELLRIAHQNDKYGALAHHLSLFLVVELATQLSRASRRGPDAITGLLGAPQAPAHFLELAAMTLVVIRRRQGAAYDSPESAPHGAAGMPIWSEFDQHSYQALVQALADMIWPERAVETFDGPQFQLCVERLTRLTNGAFLESILRNYVGNLLQTYFAEARVRYSVPSLPKETEIWLRSKDGATIASRVMAGLGKTSVQPERVLGDLRDRLIKASERPR